MEDNTEINDLPPRRCSTISVFVNNNTEEFSVSQLDFWCSQLSTVRETDNLTTVHS